MFNKKEFHIEFDQEHKTAIDYLANESGFSKQKLKRHMQQGCVWLEKLNSKSDKASYIQRLRRAKKVLNNGDILHFYYDEKVLSCEIPKATLIKDFGDYSVWNKPSGMLSQGSKWGDHSTIYRWAEKHLVPERPAFIVHRLDRAANGLIILAHKKNVASQFSKMFELREIEKYYSVLVEGDFSTQFPSDVDQNKGKKISITEKIDDKNACSHIEFIQFNSGDHASELRVQIETGRKHQIRKHLSGLGFPVVGDRLYGSKREDVNLQLQAQTLKFVCPVTLELRQFTLDY